MASIRCRKDTGLLLLDFRHHGERCREHTLLPDTAANRARLKGLADRIERAINQGTFRYSDFFPSSPRAAAEGAVTVGNSTEASQQRESGRVPAVDCAPLALFSDFANLWFGETEPRWRKRHSQSMRDTLDKILFPFFGTKRLNEITRADVLAFRAEIAKRPGRAGQTLSGKRINKLMMQLNAIVNEGCDRYGLPPAHRTRASASLPSPSTQAPC